MINAAVITETRPMAIIQQTVEDHLSMLPDDYELVVFCSKSNIRYFNAFDCRKYIVNVNTLHDYNKLMTSEFYWSKLLAFDHVLVFQTDSKILRKGIEEFYGFDFIGAPIKNIDFPCMNGGLSLRKPQTMMNILKRTPYHSMLGFEDIYYCNILKRQPLTKLPSKETAHSFSVETMFNLGSFAYHAANKYINNNQFHELISQYG